ncbi:hypothetical protein [Nostoc sp. UHCC 0302]|uniref:hypothetical protein n=1 Tax=Nostoc sp. UHCC 0302 TaxID=3134896 RepID=UPI00311CD7D1
MLNDGIDAEIAELFEEQAEIIKLKLKPTTINKAKALLEYCLSGLIALCHRNINT